MRKMHVSWFALVVLILLVSSAAVAVDSVTVPVNMTGHYTDGDTASASVDLGRRFSSISSITVQHSGTTAMGVKWGDYPLFSTYQLLCWINVSGLQNDFVGGGYRDQYRLPFPYSYSGTSSADASYWASESSYNAALLGRLDLTLSMWLNAPMGTEGGFMDIDTMSVTVEGTFAPPPEPVAQAKSREANGWISIEHVAVTWVGDSFFYIESADRSAGIRVEKTNHGLAIGNEAFVSGWVLTNADGERYIKAAGASATGSKTVSPLTISNHSLGGGDLQLQSGVWGWVRILDEYGRPFRLWQPLTGLNNIGLLVRLCGKVVEIEPVTAPAVPTWFKIDDGSDAPVKCLVSNGVTIDPTWTNVTVTGASSCEAVGNERHSLLRVCRQGDIKPL